MPTNSPNNNTVKEEEKTSTQLDEYWNIAIDRCKNEVRNYYVYESGYNHEVAVAITAIEKKLEQLKKPLQ